MFYGSLLGTGKRWIVERFTRARDVRFLCSRQVNCASTNGANLLEPLGRAGTFGWHVWATELRSSSCRFTFTGHSYMSRMLRNGSHATLVSCALKSRSYMTGGQGRCMCREWPRNRAQTMFVLFHSDLHHYRDYRISYTSLLHRQVWVLTPEYITGIFS